MSGSKCPVCGGVPTICESMSSMVGGIDRFTLCCGIGAEIVEQWELLEVLPQLYQERAIEQSRQDRDEYKRSITDAINNYTEAGPLSEDLVLKR